MYYAIGSGVSRGGPGCSVGTQKRSNVRAIRLECRGRTANEHPVYGHITACAIRYTYMIKLTFWRVNTKE